MKKIISRKAIQAQVELVRSLYARDKHCSDEYKEAFDKLADMRRTQMADQFREERGLPPHANTPYCRTRASTDRGD